MNVCLPFCSGYLIKLLSTKNINNKLSMDSRDEEYV